jgi:Fe-Mn family superoxide dismutase
MSFHARPIPFKPPRLKGLSARLIASHYENNYGGAVRRLNAIRGDLAAHDPASAQGFRLNGLKREELIATNSMLLHEAYFEALGEAGGGDPTGALAEAIARDFGSLAKWRAEFVAMGRALGGGSGWVLLTRSPRPENGVARSATSGRPTIRTVSPAARRFWRSICTSTPITSILAAMPRPMSMPS